jgi:hypothetical protein
MIVFCPEAFSTGQSKERNENGKRCHMSLIGIQPVFLNFGGHF